MRCKIPQADLVARLEGTVCMYKDVPYTVHVAGATLHLYEFPGGEMKHQITPDDPDFDVATPPLGYSQVDSKTVVYLSRKPVRKFKQGLDVNTINVQYLNPIKNKGYKFNSICTRNTMIRKYRSLKAALGTFKELLASDTFDQTEICISPDCALVLCENRMIKVYWINEEVGYLSNKDIDSVRPVVYVPNSRKAWIISVYLQQFFYEIK